MKSTHHQRNLSLMLLTGFALTACSQGSAPAEIGASQINKQAPGFYVANGKLVDANGVPFIFQGVNQPHAWYNSTTNSAVPAMRARGANSVRYVLSSGCRGWYKSPASEITSLINLAKTNKMVAVLEVHDTTGYGDDGGACTLDNAVNYWLEVKNALVGQEAYAIINIGNEPHGNNNTGSWAWDTQSAIQKLRNNGINHALMVDAPNWGQDWSNTMRSNASSVFNSDPQKNVIFSVHMYEVYNTSSKVNDYINAFANAGMPLVVGEFANSHKGSYVDAGTIMSSSKSRVNGYIGWSWSGNDSSTAALDMVNGFNANSPTGWGNMIFADMSGSRTATVFDGITGGGGSTGGGTGGGTTTPSEQTLFNFEGDTQGWTGWAVNAGPWSVNEWATSGSNSLKADVTFGNRRYELKNTAQRNLSGKTALRARVKHASWGNPGSGVTAKIFVKTGAGWSWYGSGAVTINGNTSTTLTLNLSGVPNLGDVKEIGVEFTSPSNSSGNSSIYVDQVTLQ
ncbi:cellulase family glycosylhydrolase [Deinococcus misasensis]|uniref:cellulase family glycosylhydrolase n=1 Tax=Deinococcus misasensis TaxID=392413 RepID=UPI00068BCBBB|nr:cellulase family glycosylhydrolase [Deinococcus misasensis]